jgi:uncharacterized iron-regulated membrane protein
MILSSGMLETQDSATEAGVLPMQRADPVSARITAGDDQEELGSLRRWVFLHKWSSLVCSAVLLLICMTGLPLLFADEINAWLEPHTYEALPADTPRVNLDRLTAIARERYPRHIISSMFVDDDEPQIFVSMAPSWAALKASPKSEHFIRFDARSGNLLEDSKSAGKRNFTFMGLLLRLHTDLFVDLPGELFLGSMALLFVAALVSGVVLYGPFTRRLDFGTVRRERSPRVKWLDIHNLLGVTTLVWAFVVGITGIMNELSTPLFNLWQATDVRALVAHWHDRVPNVAQLSSVQAAYATAERELPNNIITSIVFPGAPAGSPHHYVLWAKGNTPLTGRLFNPALIDASSGQFVAVVAMPWYLRVLEISRPLHFGDYGGTPLKILWALLDLVTIWVLGTGLYLWLARRKLPGEERRTRMLGPVAPLTPRGAELSKGAETVDLGS